MVWIYIICALLILFFFIRNLVSHQQYRAYQKEALFAFDDTRPIHKASRIIAFVLFVFFVGELLYLLLINRHYDLSAIMMRICLISGCALFAFVPYSTGKWLITPQGVFSYDHSLLIPFEEMVAAQLLDRGKKAFVLVKVRKLEKELLKKDSYAFMVPPADASTVVSLLRDFITLEDKAREKKRRQSLTREV